jgi:hypothetical protein
MRVWWGRTRNRLSLGLGYRLIRVQPTDRFIAAAPRSGSTWLRTMVTAVMRPDLEIHPDSFNAVIPGISIRQSRLINGLAAPRLIKTHSTWYPSMPRAVYLVRDGRDSLVSRFHFMTTRRDRPLSFEEFFDRYCRGAYGQPWHGNVEAWLGEGRRAMGERLLLVHFEQMKADPADVLGRVCTFLGIDHDADRLERGIEGSRLDRMRRIEQQELGKQLQRRDASFYRGGKAGTWRDLFTPEIQARFEELSARAMDLAGYSW